MGGFVRISETSPIFIRGDGRDGAVWIPSVPLPLFGFFADTCGCGARFRGRNRKAAYELHYRRLHHRTDDSSAEVLVQVSRAEAERIYAEVGHRDG